MIDLRSDTVTRPSAEMRRAMAKAEVGDDVFGDDPTVKRLEERMAEILGKEAALFFPSGTMSNQTAIAVQTRPGDALICETTSHVYRYESGAPAALSGVLVQTIDGRGGVLSAEQIAARIQPGSVHQAGTRLVVLENTHNAAGGRIFPLAEMQRIRALTRVQGIALHLDGARLFNAQVASGVPAREYAACADTVNTCLSKGLGAPIGSLLSGTRALIEEARRFRKRFGGGMRQVGILAAAGLYALAHNVERLAEDHENARRLAEGLAGLPGIELDPREVETNIVIFRVARPGMTAAGLIAALAERGVRVVPMGGNAVRAVTHLDVSRADVDRAIAVFAEVLRSPM